MRIAAEEAYGEQSLVEYLLADPSFYASLALVVFFGLLMYMGVFKTIAKTLDDRAEGIKNELEDAKRLREEAAEMQRQMEEEQEAREEAARQAEEKKRKKKKKGVTAGLGQHHKVHPDDVELVEPRDVGSRAMLRNLHIGNRKVRCNCCDICVFVRAYACDMRVHARAPP